MCSCLRIGFKLLVQNLLDIMSLEDLYHRGIEFVSFFLKVETFLEFFFAEELLIGIGEIF